MMITKHKYFCMGWAQVQSIFIFSLICASAPFQANCQATRFGLSVSAGAPISRRIIKPLTINISLNYNSSPKWRFGIEAGLTKYSVKDRNDTSDYYNNRLETGFEQINGFISAQYQFYQWKKISFYIKSSAGISYTSISYTYLQYRLRKFGDDSIAYNFYNDSYLFNNSLLVPSCQISAIVNLDLNKRGSQFFVEGGLSSSFKPLTGKLLVRNNSGYFEIPVKSVATFPFLKAGFVIALGKRRN